MTHTIDNPFKGLHSVSIKIRVSKNKGAIKTVELAQDAFCEMINSGDLQQLEVSSKVSLQELQDVLGDTYKGTIRFRNGVSEGCYGSTTGETFDGLTAYIDAVELPDRWETGKGDDYTEFYNPILAMQNAGMKLVCDNEEQTQTLLESLEDSGFDVKRDNSYNWNGQSEYVYPLFDFDFSVIQNNDEPFLIAIKFHNGGDPRGNYGDLRIFSCKGNEAFYEAFLPCFIGQESEEASNA